MAEKISMGANGKLQVPNNPTIPFIEGDGIGPDIWKASVHVFDAAVQKAYNGERKIEWLKVLAGEEAFNKTIARVIVVSNTIKSTFFSFMKKFENTNYPQQYFTSIQDAREWLLTIKK